MPIETPYNVNDIVYLCSVMWTIFAFLFETNANILSICSNSLLYFTLPIAMVVHFYVYNISKLQTILIINAINCIIFFSCSAFIFSQVCTICNVKIAATLTYLAALANSCIFAWFGCINIKKIIEEYGTYTPISTTVSGVQYNTVSTSIV